jgi:pyruvate/2-oxoglutarate dehydrogenase complex dihydrolipoamide acyltransferase (E2) component
VAEIKMPEAGFNITEGKIVQWYRKIGEKVDAGENIVSVETDKITVDIPAEKSGVLKEIRCKEGDVIPVGGIVGIIAEEGVASRAPQEVMRDLAQSPHKGTDDQVHSLAIDLKNKKHDERKISPAAKAIAKREGIDLSKITAGTGPGGRVVKEDVLNFMETQRAGAAPSAAAGKPAERVEFRDWRKVVADRVSRSSREVPQCTVAIETDVTELSKTISSVREKEAIHITYLPYLMKALVGGLELVPELNAYCDDEGYTILNEINIGVIVNVEGKLLIPVVKAVREKSIFDLAREIDLLVEKARDNSLGKNDIEGGTITITNVGPFKIHTGTALIFQPQTAMVQLMAAREMPAVWNGNIEVRKRMNVGVTYDHRVVDGALCGKFLMEVRRRIEDPDLFFDKSK